MRKINFVLLLLQCLSAATAQQPYSKAVKEQIARVETSLSGGIIIDGKTYTLSERMKHYNVSGLSVAVIDNYKIVWAKGYGYADKPCPIARKLQPPNCSATPQAWGSMVFPVTSEIVQLQRSPIF